MWRWMPGLQPIPSSPTRRAPSSVSSVCDQELLVRPRRRVDDDAVAELEPDALADRALVERRVLRVLDHALGRVLERREEELAARHVVVAVVDVPLAAGEREASGRCRARRSAPSRRRRTGRRSGASARPRRPSRGASRRRRSPCIRRASSRRPGRARPWGRGIRSSASRRSAAARSRPRTPCGARPGGRGREASPRVCSPGPRSGSARRPPRASRASLGAISARSSNGASLAQRLSNGTCSESMYAEPHERVRAARARSAGSPPRASAA